MIYRFLSSGGFRLILFMVDGHALSEQDGDGDRIGTMKKAVLAKAVRSEQGTNEPNEMAAA